MVSALVAVGLALPTASIALGADTSTRPGAPKQERAQELLARKGKESQSAAKPSKALRRLSTGRVTSSDTVRLAVKARGGAGATPSARADVASAARAQGGRAK
jgi:hypothetical protein